VTAVCCLSGKTGRVCTELKLSSSSNERYVVTVYLIMLVVIVKTTDHVAKAERKGREALARARI